MARHLLLLALLTIGATHTGAQTSDSELDAILARLSQIDESNQNLNRSLAARGLEIMGPDPDPAQETLLRLRMGAVQMNAGEAGSATLQFERVVELARQQKDKRLLLAGTSALGIVYTMTGKTDLAMEKSKHSLKLAIALDDPLEEIQCLSNLGMLHKELTEYEDAARCCLAALELLDKSGPIYDRARLLNNIGIIYSAAVQPERALEFLDQAYAIMDGRGDAHRYNVMINLGVCMAQLAEDQAAISYYSEAIDLAQASGDIAQMQIARVNLAVSYVRIGEFKQAIEILEPITRWLRDRDRGPDLAIALVALGISLEEIGQVDRAAQILEEARVLAQAVHATDTGAAALVALADTHAALGSYQHAFGCAQEAIELIQSQSLQAQRAALADFTAKYEGQEKQRRIESLEEKTLIAELEASRSQLQRNFLLLLSAVSVGGTFTLLLLAGSRRRTHVALVETSQELGTHRDQLQTALDEVETLRGLLPVCAHCSSIRDEEGKWHVMEAYIGSRTGATFSHGICPPCLKTHYDMEPDQFEVPHSQGTDEQTSQGDL